jgi:hypothetical protein
MSSTDAIILDDSLWPLLVTKFVRQPSLQEQQKYFAQVLGYLRREEKCVGLLDTRHVMATTADHRKKMTEFMGEHHALIRTQLLGCAVVLTSPMLQLATSVVLHFTTPPAPYFITTSLPEAAKWTAKCLNGVGQPLAAERIRYHYAPHMERHVG